MVSQELAARAARIANEAMSRPPRPVRFALTPYNEIALSSDPNYVVKGLIPYTGLVIAWGPPKCGKSFWAFDLAMHIALGREYRGRRVLKAPVVYVAAEGASGQGARVEAWRSRHLAEDANADVPFYLLPGRPDLIADADQLIHDIDEQIQDYFPAMVVLDTLNRTLNGSESSDEDMPAYLRAADKIKEHFHCAVLIIHHCGHDDTRPRGHTSLTAAADVQIAVKRDAAGLIVTTVEYAKDFAEGGQTVSTLDVVEVGTDEDGDPITSCVVLPSDETPAAATKAKRLAAGSVIALKALQEAIAEGGETPPASNHIPTGKKAVKVELWRGYAYQRSISDGEQDAKRMAFKRASIDLQGKGYVGTWGDWVWLTEAGQ